MVQIETLKKRADFINARKGRRVSTPAFLMQVLPNGTDRTRVGYTATKKLGGAVIRNRAKRRLRAAARAVLTDIGKSGFDYVLIARSAVIARGFDRLLDDLRIALVDPRNLPNGQKKDRQTPAA